MLLEGWIIKATGRWYTVETAGGERYRCAVKGSFRLRGKRTSSPVVVGDHVLFEPYEEDDTGLIREIRPRKNYIIRRSSNLSHESQIIAANIDQAMLVCSLVKPRTLIGFIDRFLVAAESYRIPVILVFNKTDLYGKKEQNELEKLTGIYRDIGYEVLHTSVPEQKNLDLFRKKLKDKTTLLSGNSGVGKSTLINTVEPSLNLKTRPISNYHKSGRHTTTYSEMFPLSSGGYIIDTPGIRGFGLVEVEKKEIYHFFPEIFQYSKGCEYYNCTHTHEPGCSVRKAVAEGKIAESRYNSYLDLYFDEEKKYR